MSQIFAESSIHGLNFIFGSGRNLFSRIFWGIIFVASLCGFCYYIHGAYVKWLIEPDIISKYYIRNITEFPTPAFTICPRIFSRRDLFDVFTFDNQSLSLSNISEDQCAVIRPNLYWCDAFESLESLDPKCYKPTTLYEDLIALIPKVKILINTVKVNVSKIITSHGICLTYNMYSKNIFKKEISNDYGGFINENDPDIEWSADNQFSKPNPSYPKNLKERATTGIFIGISDLDVENFCTWTWNKTFHFFIHPPNQIPNRLSEKFDLAWGSFNVYQFGLKSFRSSDNLRIIKPDVRKCFFEDEGNLKYFNTYTKGHCEIECFKYEVEKALNENCTIIDLPKEKSSSKDFCLERTVYKEHGGPWHLYKRRCKCHESCNYIQYSLKEVHPPFPYPNTDPSNIWTYIKINEYPIKIDEVERLPTYSIANFISDIGGFLGLFVGASMLSIIELIFFSAVKIIETLKSKKVSSDQNERANISNELRELIVVEVRKEVNLLKSQLNFETPTIQFDDNISIKTVTYSEN